MDLARFLILLITEIKDVENSMVEDAYNAPRGSMLIMMELVNKLIQIVGTGVKMELVFNVTEDINLNQGFVLLMIDSLLMTFSKHLVI